MSQSLPPIAVPKLEGDTDNHLGVGRVHFKARIVVSHAPPRFSLVLAGQSTYGPSHVPEVRAAT